MAKPRTLRLIEVAEILGVTHQRASKIVAEGGLPQTYWATGSEPLMGSARGMVPHRRVRPQASSMALFRQPPPNPVGVKTQFRSAAGVAGSRVRRRDILSGLIHEYKRIVVALAREVAGFTWALMTDRIALGGVKAWERAGVHCGRILATRRPYPRNREWRHHRRPAAVDVCPPPPRQDRQGHHEAAKRRREPR
jgi:hypothetical protein